MRHRGRLIYFCDGQGRLVSCYNVGKRCIGPFITFHLCSYNFLFLLCARLQVKIIKSQRWPSPTSLKCSALHPTVSPNFPATFSDSTSCRHRTGILNRKIYVKYFPSQKLKLTVVSFLSWFLLYLEYDDEVTWLFSSLTLTLFRFLKPHLHYTRIKNIFYGLIHIYIGHRFSARSQILPQKVVVMHLKQLVMTKKTPEEELPFLFFCLEGESSRRHVI